MTQDISTGQLVARVGGDDVVATRARYSREGSDTRWHSHDRLHVSFVFAGNGQSLSRASGAPRGDSIWCYPAGVEHRWIPESEWASSINLDLSEGFLSSLGMTEGDVRDSLFQNAELKTSLTRIAYEVRLGDSDTETSILSQLIETLSHKSTVRTTDRPTWVRQLEECLQDRWNESIALDELAVLVGVHRITISKSFRKYFGTTLGDYKRRLRIERSLARVTGSDECLANIALDCGFSDQSHFTRTFRSRVGAAPGQLRRRLG